MQAWGAAEGAASLLERTTQLKRHRHLHPCCRDSLRLALLSCARKLALSGVIISLFISVKWIEAIASRALEQPELSTDEIRVARRSLRWVEQRAVRKRDAVFHDARDNIDCDRGRSETNERKCENATSNPRRLSAT